MLDRFFLQPRDTWTVRYILVVAVYCVRRKSMKYTFLFPQFSHFQERGRGEERRRRQTNTSIRGTLYYPLVSLPPPLHFGQEQTLFGKSMPECFLRISKIFDHGRVWKREKENSMQSSFVSFGREVP